MTDHNTDIGFTHAKITVDIDELIAGSSLGTENARAVHDRIDEARAVRIVRVVRMLSGAPECTCGQEAAEAEPEESREYPRALEEAILDTLGAPSALGTGCSFNFSLFSHHQGTDQP